MIVSGMTMWEVILQKAEASIVQDPQRQDSQGTRNYDDERQILLEERHHGELLGAPLVLFGLLRQPLGDLGHVVELVPAVQYVVDGLAHDGVDARQVVVQLLHV